MFRAISLFGLGVVCFITAMVALLFSIRIARDESWPIPDVVFVVFFILSVVAFGGVYIGRRREIHQ